MGNKKHIVIAAVLAMLATGISPTMANSSNSLLQMDVKKSSVSDTVDVTFYTTAPSANSVVTRKSNNRYVVLLPNTNSSSSITPGIGGVKDLISDIEVKHVNDGIGGYTKVTFSTTKPINIKTYIKKTNPLSQTQRDYKEIIAKNDVNSIKLAPQTKSETITSTPQANTQKQAPKPQSTQQPVKDAANINGVKLVSVNPDVVKSQTRVTTPAVAPSTGLNFSGGKEIKVTNNIKQAVTQPLPAQNITKVEPEKPVVEKPQESVIPPVQDVVQEVQQLEVDNSSKPVNEEVSTAVVETTLMNKVVSTSKQVKNRFSDLVQRKEPLQIPSWWLIASGAVLGSALLYMVLNAFIKLAQKNKEKWDSLFAVTDAKPTQRKMSDYEEIVNNIELSWQEKYRRYNEKESQLKKDNTESGVTYVTDLSGKQSVIPALVSAESERFTVRDVDAKEKGKMDDVAKIGNEEEFKKQMHAKISELEHSVAQVVSSENIVDNFDKYQSEDDTIISKISNVKLKSFSKPVSLKQSNRSLLEDENKATSRNKSYKEGRFVKLKSSPLSVTRRNSAATNLNLNVSDLINTGSKYLMNNGEMKMSKEKENYLLSSLDEYLSILDDEFKSGTTLTKTSVADSLAQMKSSSVAMSRSGVTNPISRASNPISAKTPTPYMNGLVVKSGYNIDAEKGIYLVNIDGVSALVGRINDNVFILKKFDSVIDKPLQVRQDDANVYIVKAGRYKCLVDVSKDKMGTLIEI